METWRCEVDYNVATYSGVEIVFIKDPNIDSEDVCARAKAQVKRKAGGSLPFGLLSFREVSRVRVDNA